MKKLFAMMFFLLVCSIPSYAQLNFGTVQAITSVQMQSARSMQVQAMQPSNTLSTMLLMNSLNATYESGASDGMSSEEEKKIMYIVLGVLVALNILVLTLMFRQTRK